MDCIIYLYTAHLLYSLCVCWEMSNCASILNSWSQTGINDGANLEHWESEDKTIYCTLIAWPDPIHVYCYY